MIERPASATGRQIEIFDASTSREIETAFRRLAQNREPKGWLLEPTLFSPNVAYKMSDVLQRATCFRPSILSVLLSKLAVL